MAGAGGARGGGPRGSRRGAHGGDVGRVRAASSAGPRRRYRASSSAPKAGSRREIIVARRDVLTSSSSRWMSHSCAFQGFLRHSASARERCRRAASARPPARRRRSWMDASGTGRRSESSNPNRASKPRGVRSTPPARPFANPNRAGARNLGSPRPPPSSSSRAPRRWTPAEGKNKSSVYKWVPATGELPGEDVESAPSERAKQFEAVPIGEVTLGMPQPPKPAT